MYMLITAQTSQTTEWLAVEPYMYVRMYVWRREGVASLKLEFGDLPVATNRSSRVRTICAEATASDKAHAGLVLSDTILVECKPQSLVGGKPQRTRMPEHTVT
jgi:hypothetical protein